MKHLPRLLAFAFLVSLPAASATPPPNVLFLFADDMNPDTVAALGNPQIQTPNLDRLVKRGLVFNRAYAQGSMNAATCIPSRAMLLTGRSLFRVDEQIRNEKTWPEAFQKAGYTTFISGKWHNDQQTLLRSFQNARSVFVGGMTNPLQAKVRDKENGKLTAPRIAPTHACEAFADEAIRFLKEHQTGPFLCYLPFDAPHDPHIVPENYSVHYSPGDLPIPPNFLPSHPWDNGEMQVRDEKLLPSPRTPDAVREMNAEYYRYITYLDSQIGRVLDALEASRFAKNTLIVFTADSGAARGSHGLIGKQNLYEHSIRLPTLIAGPGIPEGKRTDAMCYLFDLFPTLGSLCGIEPVPGSEGIDLTTSIQDPSKPARPHLFFAYKEVQRAIRDGQWKLIRYPQVNKTQLFDLAADPYETRNLADAPENAARVEGMLALLQNEMKRAGDTASP